ncbi:cadherin domain protein [Dictyocaulus viviparus]|uniref:Cadherin domain protein n=1 Tax=Dictyocaulus viviparus TaxID=29172 RepID=A0A0D8XUA3_DICVI|nr:cadherin domain protein [Dictyocaulus viviparus]
MNSCVYVKITSKTAPGTIIGEVHAIDADGGIHGIPTYRIEPPNHLVTVGRNTGLISLTSRPETQRNRTIERIMVIASSSYTQQSSATVYIEISDFWLREEYMSFSSNIFTIGVVVMVVLTMLLVCLLGCCLINYRLSKPKEVDSPNKQIYTVSRYRTSTFANNNVQHLACSTVQDLPSNILEKSSSTTSSALSNSVQRNSLTYHRDVTSTRSQPDSGIDQDAVSVNSSITEYLVSIGLNPNPKFSKQRLQKPDTIDSALSEYIYAQLDEIPPSEPHKVSENVHRPEELYPPPLTAPTFRPLSEIFDELEEMQRERPMEREYVQVEI